MCVHFSSTVIEKKQLLNKKPLSFKGCAHNYFAKHPVFCIYYVVVSVSMDDENVMI